VDDEDVDLMQRLDALHLRHPFKGSRRLLPVACVDKQSAV